MNEKKLPLTQNSPLKIERNDFRSRRVLEKLIVSTHSYIHIIEPSDILYLKASSNYTLIVIDRAKSILASKTLKYFEQRLSGSGFIRVHGSFLVNVDRISAICKKGKNKVVLDHEIELPLSAGYRTAVLQRFQIK